MKRIHISPSWLLLGLCMMNLFFMHYYIISTSRVEWSAGIMSYLDNLVAVSFDIGVVFFVFYFLTGRRQKYTLYLCFAITLLWSFCNMFYSRFFYQYLSLSAIGQAQALVDKGIFDCVMNNFRPIDLYYPLCLVLFVYLTRKYFIKTKSPIKKYFTFFLLCVVLDISYLFVYRSLKPERKTVASFTTQLYSRHFSIEEYSHSPNYTNFLRGSLFSLFDELVLIHKESKTLSSKEKEVIRRTINDTKTSINIEENGIKTTNIIFILVESYMSFTSDLIIEGKEVTPYLNALKRDSMTYYNGLMRDNLTVGASSDGQFIYMTGLLPLRSVVTVSEAQKVTLPGLPQKLGRESRMIIPTITSMWNQDAMCRQYGFDHLYSCNDYIGEHKNNLNDEQVFELAMQKDKESTSPFFSIILTLSMHQPYIEEEDETFKIKDSTIPSKLRCYLNKCHYTDRQIGKYLEHLKVMGLYKNSLIIIASDHPVHIKEFGNVREDIPLYIVNADNSKKHLWNLGKCNQLDVYPTLLDLLGIESDWYGLGQSLLSPHYQDTITDQKWDVSEWILLSNYFKITKEGNERN